MTRHSRPVGRIEQPFDLSNRMSGSMSTKMNTRRFRRARAQLCARRLRRALCGRFQDGSAWPRWIT